MKIPFFTSLYGRVFAIFWLTLLMVLIGVLVAQHHDPRAQRDLPHRLKKEYQVFTDRLENKLTVQKGTLEEKINVIETLSKQNKIRVFFTNIEGERVDLHLQKLSKDLRNFITLADDPSCPQQRIYRHRFFAGPFLIKIDDRDLHFYLSKPWRDKPPFYISILDRPFQLLFVIMVISTPLLLWLAWAVTRPARRLQAAAERVAKGDFEIDRELENGPREFQRAGQSFNQMVSAINQMIGGQQRLLSDISHELRSPLTRLRMANAIAIRKQGESNELLRVEIETQRMEKMLHDLLVLSRMQLDSQMSRDVHALKALWEPLFDNANFEAEQLSKTLHHNVIPELKLQGNAALLYSGFENVVRNAIKYANAHVDVIFSLKLSTLVIEISDDGEGVPDAELKHIFRPFYRVSSARDRESGGTGLGLAITDSAMRQHQGQASAYHNEKGGLTVRLTLVLTPYS